MLTFAKIIKPDTMKRISIYLMMLLLCAASCNKDNANGAAEGTNSGTVDPQPEPQPEDGEPAEIDFNNIDPNDPYYKNNRGSSKGISGNQVNSITETPWKYEQWLEAGNGTMTVYDNGNFKATWSNCGDYLARVGFKYGTYIDRATKNYIADYQFTKTGSAGYGYIGAYGWTYEPIVEYYIVDDWYGNMPPYDSHPKGQFTVDGATYTVYTVQRINSPSYFGENKTFTSVFSVRESRRQQGRIHISTHFDEWNKKGITLGKIAELTMLAEAGGNATGSVEFTYLNLMDLPVE